jgi:hypothetical protein
MIGAAPVPAPISPYGDKVAAKLLIFFLRFTVYGLQMIAFMNI